jgi:ABC-type sugar transport system ATPase subunit
MVNFTLRRSVIPALLGEDGAGKSTLIETKLIKTKLIKTKLIKTKLIKTKLIKTLTGVVARDAGTLGLNGVAIAPRLPQDATRAGIATVSQEGDLVPNRSVARSLLLGRQRTRFGLVRDGEMWRRPRALLPSRRAWPGSASCCAQTVRELDAQPYDIGLRNHGRVPGRLRRLLAHLPEFYFAAGGDEPLHR